ncbi:hypothetical protein LINPERHAP1_LOCUS15433, partial [Linum perenne]
LRTSKTATDPNRDFFGCRNWSTKHKRGCRFFQWCNEDKLADTADEAHVTINDAAAMIQLRLENAKLKQENEVLKLRLALLGGESTPSQT